MSWKLILGRSLPPGGHGLQGHQSDSFFLIFGGSLPGTSSARHAETAGVKISLEHLDQNIRLTIQDNGKGLPSHTGEIIDSPRLGMVGMRARARHSGGRLTATSEMPQGL